MHRSTLLVLLLAAAALVALSVGLDPFAFLAPAGDVPEDASRASPDPAVEGPTMEGHPDARTPEEGWFEGDPVGVLALDRGTVTLAGRVTGEGSPLAMARVRPALAPPHDGRAVRTRPDGTYEIRGLAAEPLELRAGAEGYLGRTVAVPAGVEGTTTEVETIDLALRPPRTDGLQIRVTDAVGRPLPGARVLVTTMDAALHLAMGPEMAGQAAVIHRGATTDAAGRVRVVSLPPERYNVAVLAEGFQVAFQRGVSVAAGRVRHLLFRLQPGVAIEGVVTDADGAPLADAYVLGFHVPSWVPSDMVRTAPDGSFVLDGLREGSYMLIGVHDDYGETIANPVASPSRGVRLRLAGAGAVRLAVVRPDGTPVARYRVRPHREVPFGYHYSVSFPVEDAEGRTRLVLPPGTWHLSVKAPEGDFDRSTTAQVRVGEETEATVVLPLTHALRGVVVDPDGNHVPGAEVYVRRGGFPTEPVREQYARTDEDGRFEITGLPPERVGLHARHERFAPTVQEVDASEAKREITIRLPRGAVVRGRVLEEEGAPLAGEQVNIFPLSNFFEARTTTTDEDGAYRFEGVAAGTYTVSTGPLEAWSRGASRSGVGVGAEGVVTVDFTLERAAGQGVLAGTVRAGGQPLAGVTVSAVDERGFEERVSALTDEAGAFRLEGLKPGELLVTVESDAGHATMRRARIEEDGSSEPLEVDFGVAALRARLVDARGHPVSGAWVQVERVDVEEESWRRVRASTTSDTQGVIRAAGLEAGTYRIRVSATGFATLLTAPVRLREEGTTDLGDLPLSEGAALEGRAVDDTGAPVEDATVSLRDGRGRSVFLFSLVTTGSDGRWRVADLEPGDYTLRLEATGYAPAEQPVALGPEGARVQTVLSRGGVAEIRVVDEAGLPLVGVRVTLRDGRGEVVERTLSLVNLFQGGVGLTDAQGVARIPDLAPGAYTAEAARDGWVLSGDPVPLRIASGATTAAVLALVPAR